MADSFATFATGLDSPGYSAAAVTPDDNTDLTTHARALWIGVAGNVKVTTSGGNAVTFTGAQAGSILPVRVARVWSTGTTATNITAIW